MVDVRLEQRLSHLLSPYGLIDSIQHLPDARGSFTLLVTMKSPQQALQIHHALGLELFGFDSLLADQAWLEKHLPNA
jgi:hypothetical protein